MKPSLPAVHFLICFLLILFAPTIGTAQTSTLVPVPFAALSDQIVFDRDIWNHRDEILAGIDDNLAYLNSDRADVAYGNLAGLKLEKENVRASLIRFRELLVETRSSGNFRERLQREFQLYRSVGKDGGGTVKFTGYFQPIYQASREKSREYRFPIYRLPVDFASWPKPHPTRVFIEGYSGRGNPASPAWGNELAWMKSRWEAFMIHVQGSALLEFPDGTSQAIGFAAGTEHPFRGVPQSFLNERKVAWPNLGKYFAGHPEDLNALLSRNNRYIFFKELPQQTPIGSLGTPVIAERSMATDKIKLPPGALGLIRTQVPRRSDSGKLRLVYESRFVLDQDTGSAIKGPGRVDLYMGTGIEAQQKANMIYSNGELYYLLLKSGMNSTVRF